MILVIGATGFTGRFVVKELDKRKIPFKCLVRNLDKLKEVPKIKSNYILGNITDRGSLSKAFQGCTGVINIVSFKDIDLPILLSEFHAANIDRVIFISTTAIFTNLPAKSKALRLSIEEKIKQSGLNWTILRPTMIYGAPGDRNMERLIRVVKKFSFHPILGSGKHLMQPIHVQDLSKAIVDSYYSQSAYKKAYNLSGKQPLSYRECVQIVAKILNKRVILIPIPKFLAYYLAEICFRIPLLPNVKGEQVLRLNENKNFSHKNATNDFNFKPNSFYKGVRIEINKLNEIND